MEFRAAAPRDADAEADRLTPPLLHHYSTTDMTTDTITPLAPEQGTSLTIVSETLTEFEKVAAGLGSLQQRFAGVVYDVSTGKGMDQAKSDRMEVREVRYAVQGTAKKAKDTLNEQKKLIEEKAAYIVGEITKIEDPIDATIKAEEKRKADEKAAREKAERERIAAIAVKLAAIRANEVVLAGTPSSEIESVVARMSAAVPTEAEFGDMHKAAMRAHDETLLRLRHHITAAQAHEAHLRALAEQQAELARQQEAQRVAAAAAAAAAKAEADRLAQERREFEAKQAAARAEAQRLADERIAAEREAFKAECVALQLKLDEQRAALDRELAELAALQPKPVQVLDAMISAQSVDTFAPDNGVCGSRPLADKPVVEIAPEAPVPEEKATLTLGEIQRLLGLPITSLLLADLGHPAADIPGTNAKLYKPSEFGAICRTLIAHIAKAADEFDAARN